MGQLVFQAALGGQVNLVGPNTASTFNLNVPAATDTLVGRATTDTLTNKTLTSPVVSGGTIDNAVIGGTTAVAGSFTTVTASTSVTAPFLTSAASTSLLLKSAGTTAVTIDTSQNVGIGTSSPGDKLQIGSGNSSVKIGANGANNFQIYNGALTQDGTNYAFAQNYTGQNTQVNAASGGQILLQIASTTKATIDSSGNLGLGVTPSAWTTFKALQIGTTGNLFASNSGNTSLAYNAYFNGTNYIYQVSDYAQRYSQSSSGHLWYNAPSGTAGNAITFTQAMTLTNGGNLYIGATSGSSRLGVNGSIDLQNNTTPSTRLSNDVLALSVSTSATTIASGYANGSVVIVTGYSGGNQFADLVFYAYGSGHVTVLSSQNYGGSPSARTYTVSTYDLKLAMASGTYSITTTQLQAVAQ